ncbi:MAG TPA: GGDEF domain-containing protein [Vicinamibacterales bacterium]|nr:GGDEF domain-containing protein [Vicinamibacterales bacterium]
MQQDWPAFDRAPDPLGLTFNARALAGGVELVVAMLLLILFMYRRRIYLLAWAIGWGLTAFAMLMLARGYASEHLGRAAVGVSKLLPILGALAFVAGADAYRRRSRFTRLHAVILLPLAIWFTLAPLALGIRAVVVPGHVIASAALATAAGAHFLLYQREKLVGAGFTGLALLLVAFGQVSTAVRVSANIAAWNEIELRALFSVVMLSILAAISMHFFAFEEMTIELQHTNKRLEKAQADLRQMVITDALTGCHNRRFFDAIIKRELNRHRRYEIPLSVLFVDVDRFKAINDTYGHETGDRVLAEVAAFLARHVREADYLFRWGGDEFLILLSCTEVQALRKGAELGAAFKSSAEHAKLPTGVGLSVGCAEVLPDSDVMDVIRRADERMYDAKKGGKRKRRTTKVVRHHS